MQKKIYYEEQNNIKLYRTILDNINDYEISYIKIKNKLKDAIEKSNNALKYLKENNKD
jgi:CRISPR/Cas system-associated exonuclease Cas4 (RecB family)